MSQKEFKYDVAFSFLAEDEPLVLQLNNLVKGRLKTFVYSEKQEILAGTDGEKTFSDVFGSEARIVVVLFREKWGSTKWTRIEETTIRNRAYEDGYDFTLFIPLDPSPSVPKWLPKTRLWFGIEKWGIEAAAGVIELKVQEAGGSVKQETAVDGASLLAQEIAFRKKRKEFLESNEGVNSSNKEIEELYNEICKIAEEVSKQSDDTKCQIIRNKHRLVISSNGITLDLIWLNRYYNTLSDSELTVYSLLGFPKLPGYDVYNDPKILSESKYCFEIDQMNRYGWREKKVPERFLPTKEFADHCMKLFIEKISKEMKKTSVR